MDPNTKKVSGLNMHLRAKKGILACIQLKICLFDLIFCRICLHDVFAQSRPRQTDVAAPGAMYLRDISTNQSKTEIKFPWPIILLQNGSEECFCWFSLQSESQVKRGPTEAHQWLYFRKCAPAQLDLGDPETEIVWRHCISTVFLHWSSCQDKKRLKTSSQECISVFCQNFWNMIQIPMPPTCLGWNCKNCELTVRHPVYKYLLLR